MKSNNTVVVLETRNGPDLIGPCQLNHEIVNKKNVYIFNLLWTPRPIQISPVHLYWLCKNAQYRYLYCTLFVFKEIKKGKNIWGNLIILEKGFSQAFFCSKIVQDWIFTFATIFLKLFYQLSQKSQNIYMKKIILHFCTTPLSNFMVCWFQNNFVLVVPSNLSWGCTLEVFVPQHGLREASQKQIQNLNFFQKGGRYQNLH